MANLQCNGELHSTSNYGATSVDLAAPGSYIYSTSTGDGTSNSSTSIPASSCYEYMSGTSMAAPMVAGVAAMLYSCYDYLSMQDIKNIILDSVTPLESLSGKCVSQGTLNAYAAVQLAQNNSVTQTASPIPTISAQPTIPSKTISPIPTVMDIPEVTITPPMATIVPTEATLESQQPSLMPTATITSTVIPAFSATPIITPLVSPIVTTKPTPTIVGATFPAIPTMTPDITTTSSVVPPTPQTTITPTPNVTQKPVYDFLTINKVAISGGNTRYIGTSYTITPKVSGGNGNYQYRYQISKNGKNYVNKAYSKNSSIKWTPTASGNYQVKISVRDTNGYDDYYSLKVHVANMKIKSLKASKILKKGTTTKFTAKANSGFGTLTYKFTIKRLNSSYSRKQSSKKNIFAWKTPAKGTYKLTLQITDLKKNTVKKIYIFKVKK